MRCGVMSLAAAFVVATCWAGGSEAQTFAVSTNLNIFGFDIRPGIRVPAGDQATEVNFCQNACRNDASCMAFTWVRPGVQGPTGMCWLKASSLFFENHGLGRMTADSNTVTGVKLLDERSCWARHIGNLKFCNVVGGISCPAGSRAASIRRSSPGAFSTMCVALRTSPDPGGLPNCTDAFGGDSHEAGVLGNPVNQACLDD
jgi:hypothetical protein